MAPELSSNWKRLQATLKKESKASDERKRKAAPTERHRNTIAKRRRLEGKPVQAPPKKIPTKEMGSMMSSRAIEEEQAMEDTSSASLALWAADNDISARDLAEAYGGSMKDTSIQGAMELMEGVPL